MLRDSKVYMPKDKRLRAEVIQLHRNILVEEYKKQKLLVVRSYKRSQQVCRILQYMPEE